MSSFLFSIDKMVLKVRPVLFFVIVSLFGIGESHECTQKNVSCNDIKTDGGFKFSHGGPTRIEISVYSNETKLAHAVLRNQDYQLSSEVLHMDNCSVITRHCRDLHVKCIVLVGEFVKDTCFDYKTIEEMKNPSVSPQGTSWGLIIGVLFLVIALIVIVVISSCCFSWKRELRKRQGAATARSFFTQLRTCACLRTSQAQTGGGETGLSETPSDPGSRGSGQNGIQPDRALESVLVHSIDPPADGTTPESLSLDRNLSDEGIQPSKNGEVSGPDVNTASDHRAMHRNLRDDPGGVSDKGKDVAQRRDTSNGWTRPEDHESAEQPLLQNDGAAVQDSDMTGEAGALVNKRSFDPDQVSRCSTAPDADVESTSNMKNQ